MSWYALFKGILFVFGRAVARIQVEGREHLPDRGPFLLLPNHQSVLDPILIQSSIRRNDIYTLTKSTQFRGQPFRWLLPRVHTVPARRYRVDPQAVRVLLRRLDQGHIVCIYAEGERSWDGSIQPLRRGTLRLVLKAGVPVVPCGIVGTYDIWPRWSRKLRRGPVRIRFGEPMHFGKHDDREEREALLPATHDRIRTALARLTGAPLADDPSAHPDTPAEDPAVRDVAREPGPGEGAHS